MRRFILLIALCWPLTGLASSDTANIAHDEDDNSPALAIELRLLAEQGDANAQFLLGEIYFNGDGVTKDFIVAASWYRKAALQGHVKAQDRLGLMYANGMGVSRDYAESEKWFFKSDNQRDALAQQNLNVNHANGQSVPMDDKTKSSTLKAGLNESETQKIERLIKTYTKKTLVLEILDTCDGRISIEQNRRITTRLGAPQLDLVTASTLLRDAERCQFDLDQLEASLSERDRNVAKARSRDYRAPTQLDRWSYPYRQPSQKDMERGVMAAAACVGAAAKNGILGPATEKICACATTKMIKSPNATMESAMRFCIFGRSSASEEPRDRNRSSIDEAFKARSWSPIDVEQAAEPSD